MQPSPSSQTTDVPSQSPPVQVSPAVHLLSSSQAPVLLRAHSLPPHHNIIGTHVPIITVRWCTPPHTGRSAHYRSPGRYTHHHRCSHCLHHTHSQLIGVYTHPVKDYRCPPCSRLRHHRLTGHPPTAPSRTGVAFSAFTVIITGICSY